MKTHPVYQKALAGEFLGAAELAACIRSKLKTEFPETKFSIRSSNYSGGSSVSVTWTDGPTAKQVEQITGRFQTKGFDGMIDLAYHKKLWIYPDGSVSLAHSEGTEGSRGYHAEYIGSPENGAAVLAKFGGSYVSTQRTKSAALLHRAIDELWSYYRVANEPKPTVEDGGQWGAHLKGPDRIAPWTNNPTGYAYEYLGEQIYRHASRMSPIHSPIPGTWED